MTIVYVSSAPTSPVETAIYFACFIFFFALTLSFIQRTIDSSFHAVTIFPCGACTGLRGGQGYDRNHYFVSRVEDFFLYILCCAGCNRYYNYRDQTNSQYYSNSASYNNNNTYSNNSNCISAINPCNRLFWIFDFFGSLCCCFFRGHSLQNGSGSGYDYNSYGNSQSCFEAVPIAVPVDGNYNGHINNNNNGPVVLKGWARTYDGSVIRRLKRYHFVLTPGTLRYYKEETHNYPFGVDLKKTLVLQDYRFANAAEFTRLNLSDSAALVSIVLVSLNDSNASFIIDFGAEANPGYLLNEWRTQISSYFTLHV